MSLCSQIELEPLEVAIINMTNKIGDLRNVLSKEPCDPKLLQMQLQGGIATSVNQVSTAAVIATTKSMILVFSSGSVCHRQVLPRGYSHVRADLSSPQVESVFQRVHQEVS